MDKIYSNDNYNYYSDTMIITYIAPASLLIYLPVAEEVEELLEELVEEVVEALLDCGYLKTLPAPDDADAGRRGCALLVPLLDPLEVVGAAVD